MGAGGDEKIAGGETFSADADFVWREEVGEAAKSGDVGVVVGFFAIGAGASHGDGFPVHEGRVVETEVAGGKAEAFAGDGLSV